ncbi:hypothetical protein [Sphingorhabdus sp. Alg239-R122]|uniref:hypothetical protein n=1 Tax=Sphingorhabdus sp. Alg239-R122 TaxID=2305989 RepID=UPI0013DB679A|nr:hypothetical protein [Sphingorhabdus sp. Alg239-R122]
MVKTASSPSPLTDFTPVPIRHRHDGWTPERQRELIAAMAAHGTVRGACRAMGMSDSGAYQLRLKAGAEEFCRAWDLAVAQGLMVMEDIAHDRALSGWEEPIMYHGKQVGTRTRHDNRLLMFMLAARKPATYARRTQGGVGKAEIAKLKRQWHAEWEAEKKTEEEAARGKSDIRMKLDKRLADMRQRLIENKPDMRRYMMHQSLETAEANKERYPEDYAFVQRLWEEDAAEAAAKEDTAVKHSADKDSRENGADPPPIHSGLPGGEPQKPRGPAIHML